MKIFPIKLSPTVTAYEKGVARWVTGIAVHAAVGALQYATAHFGGVHFGTAYDVAINAVIAQGLQSLYKAMTYRAAVQDAADPVPAAADPIHG